MRNRTAAVLAGMAVLAAGTASAEELSYGQLGGLMTVMHSNDVGAFSIGPEWSESTGLSILGRLGFATGDTGAIGVILEGGENVFEGIFNLGATLSPDVSAVLSFGLLRENLRPIGLSDREWVEQQMAGLAITGGQFGLDLFYVASDSTANFEGAVTYGVEAETRVVLSETAMIAASLGYQRSEWDNAALGVDEALTGSIDLGIRASDTLSLSAFADHNLSQTLYGIGAGWALGTMALDLEYVYTDPANGTGQRDDQRLTLSLSMPLGGQSFATRGSALPYYITASSQGTTGANILAEVMRRPTYLPTGVIVQQGEEGEPLTLANCEGPIEAQNYEAVDADQFETALFVGGTFRVVTISANSGGTPTTATIVSGEGVFDSDAFSEADFIAEPYPEFVLISDTDVCTRFTYPGDEVIVVGTAWYADDDGDGYGDPTDVRIAENQPTGYVDNDGDCNDGDVAVNPDADEILDGIDNNCDGNTDEGLLTTFYLDEDDDGYGRSDVSVEAATQPAGYVNVDGDCNDSVADINPDADEVFDGVDNNCDGSTDEGFPDTVPVITFDLLEVEGVEPSGALRMRAVFDVSTFMARGPGYVTEANVISGGMTFLGITAVGDPGTCGIFDRVPAVVPSCTTPSYLAFRFIPDSSGTPVTITFPAGYFAAYGGSSAALGPITVFDPSAP